MDVSAGLASHWTRCPPAAARQSMDLLGRIEAGIRSDHLVIVQPPATTFHCATGGPTCANPAPKPCEFALPRRLLILLFAAVRLFVCCSCTRRVCCFALLMSRPRPPFHECPPIEFRPCFVLQPFRSPLTQNQYHHAQVAHHRAPSLCGKKILQPGRDAVDATTPSNGDQIFYSLFT